MSTNATIQNIRDLVSSHDVSSSEDKLKQVELSIENYGKQLAVEKDIQGLEELLVVTQPFYEVLGKAKAAKLIRVLVEQCLSIDQGKKEKVSLVRKCIDWATTNKRVFLKRTLEARLIRLHNENGDYPEAMKLAAPLSSELKKLEDRELLMEVTLEESKSAFFLKNYSKAKASLVLARTTSTGAFVSTAMQASIDLHSGILFAADDKDYRTAYSYCYEALEGYILCEDKKNSIKALKYMCLCKIMGKESDQIGLLLSTKMALSVKGESIDAMKCMAEAFNKRSLTMFQKCLETYKKDLVEDPVVAAHSQQLHQDMLEKDISRVIEPYSVVDFTHIVNKIGEPQKKVEKAVSTMLLDKKIYGCIDQYGGMVTVYPNPPKDKTYQKGVELIHQLSQSVDGIYVGAGKLMN